MKNVLVFSCGAIPAVDINFALRGSKEYRVFGASSYDDHGLYIYENYIRNVPFLSDPDFLEKFNEILVAYAIDFVILLHEDMILYFQEHKDQLKATVISSCYETAVLCRYKSKTYARLSDCDFTPKTYEVDQVTQYPVFVKKDTDQGARNAYKVENKDELLVHTASGDMVICEYLPGEEVTVDCFTDRHGTLRFVNPRAADRMLAGIDVHARRLMVDAEIQSIAQQINDRISFRGPWFFQIKRDREGKFKLLEIATRFAGAFGMTRCMDINIPLLALQDFEEKDIVVDYNDIPIEADKIFIGRYTIPLDYNTVVLDNVDAMMIDRQVDVFFMMFVYQCINKNKTLVLLCNDAEKTAVQLQTAKISEGLFAFAAPEDEGEGLYEKAIFISRNDERRCTIRQKYGIPCYSPTVVEALLDWKG